MQIRFGKRFEALRDDERGMTTVEYVIVLCLIAAISVGTWQTFGDEMLGHLTGAQTKFNGAFSKAGM